MTDWTTLDLDGLLPGEPLTSEKVLAFYQNVIAAFEGSAGAPPLLDAALDTGAATSAGTDWVLLRTAGADVNAVGSYAFLRFNTLTTAIEGTTHAGSSLRYSNANGAVGATGPSGTWRLMGSTQSTNDERSASLFLRIS
jgi:hypothetical protein